MKNEVQYDYSDEELWDINYDDIEICDYCKSRKVTVNESIPYGDITITIPILQCPKCGD